MRAAKKTGVARSRATERVGNGVIKHYDSHEKAEAAAVKYRLLAGVGGAVFRSPTVRKVHDDPPSIEFELLDSQRPIDEEIVRALGGADPVEAMELVGSVGCALALIHEGLDLPTTTSHSRAPALKAQLNAADSATFGPIPRVTLHGDFGASNIAVGFAGELLIYDPEPSRYTTGAINSVDVPEMDLATFVTCLAGRTRGLRNMRVLHGAYRELSGAFLDGYAAARSVDRRMAFGRERLAALMTAQGAAYRSVAGGPRGQMIEILARWAARNLPTEPFGEVSESFGAAR